MPIGKVGHEQEQRFVGDLVKVMILADEGNRSINCPVRFADFSLRRVQTCAKYDSIARDKVLLLSGSSRGLPRPSAVRRFRRSLSASTNSGPTHSHLRFPSCV
jgi:hypothetical protein